MAAKSRQRIVVECGIAEIHVELQRIEEVKGIDTEAVTNVTINDIVCARQLDDCLLERQ